MSEQIHEKLDAIAKDITDIKVTLAVNTEQLAEHMRRSLANEKAVSLLAQDLIPIKVHVANIKFIGKIFAVILASGGAIIALIKSLF